MHPLREAISRHALDVDQINLRESLAEFAAHQMSKVGSEIALMGNIIGEDRLHGASSTGNGSDELAGMGLLLQIAGELTATSASLFASRHTYSAASLLRQLVEVEYLAWAFDTRDKDAERWLRSSNEERQQFFKPAKLRAASEGKFRGKDYGYHCEMAGHPTPTGQILLANDLMSTQLLLSDLLGHVGRIWDHAVSWAVHNNEPAILTRRSEMRERFREWLDGDRLTRLPPPP